MSKSEVENANLYKKNKLTYGISQIIFLGRWLQAPLYLGLLIILAAYVYSFFRELCHIVWNINNLSHGAELMLGVLDLIDVVMIANLLIMVIMGGYETFVSHLQIESNHPDQPEWLDHLDAGAMKIKVALALIGISSIHLLRTFIDPAKQTNDAVFWQVTIHVTLLVSAVAIVFTNWMLSKTK